MVITFSQRKVHMAFLPYVFFLEAYRQNLEFWFGIHQPTADVIEFKKRA